MRGGHYYAGRPSITAMSFTVINERNVCRRLLMKGAALSSGLRYRRLKPLISDKMSIIIRMLAGVV